METFNLSIKITKAKLKTLLIIFGVILVIDVFLTRYWVSIIKPDPFMSIRVESYKLQIYGINILLGIIVYFIKKRISILFFINTIICYWIFYLFWNAYIENHPYSETLYYFKIENCNFELHISENPDSYGIYELIPNATDSLRIIELGLHKKIGDSIQLQGWDQGKLYNMYYYNYTLTGLPINPSTIKLSTKKNTYN